MPNTEDAGRLWEQSKSVRATAFPSIFPTYHNTFFLRDIYVVLGSGEEGRTRWEVAKEKKNVNTKQE